MDSIQVTADALSLHTRAIRLVKAGRHGAARPLLAAAQALAPPSPDFILTGARISMAGGAWEEALLQLDNGVDIAPAHSGLRKCRAEVRRRTGDREGAVRDAAEAVINDKTDVEAKVLLGSTLLNLGRIEDSIACLAEAMEADPSNTEIRSTLALALERNSDTDLALQVLIQGISLAPGTLGLRNAAILLCIRRRNFVLAVQLADEARVEGVADACTFGMKGHSLSSLGDNDKAILAYQEALKLAPEDAYVRHLVAAATTMADPKRAPEDYIRTVFNGYADRFENHLSSLEYGVPAAIHDVLLNHPKIASGLTLGKALDLGCGTGLVAKALSGLPIHSFTGIDLSPRMLAHARAKQIYAELREGDIVADLAAHADQWPLIIAADVLCYMGALDELLALVHARLEPGGWFMFSVERLLPDADGQFPGNGNWALQRQGRYAHAEHYVYEALCVTGFRLLRMERPVVRQEAGADVPGLLLAVERTHNDH